MCFRLNLSLDAAVGGLFVIVWLFFFIFLSFEFERYLIPYAISDEKPTKSVSIKCVQNTLKTVYKILLHTVKNVAGKIIPPLVSFKGYKFEIK